MSTRADELHRAYEELLAEERMDHTRAVRQHIIPAAVFDALVQENQDNLKMRPSFAHNTAVIPSQKGIERLDRLVTKYSPLLEDFKLLPKGWPRLDVLHFAFWKAFSYVPFTVLLDDLSALVKRAVRHVRHKGTFHHVVVLALPDGRVDKSSIWFNSWSWQHVPALRQVVDFVVPSMEAVRALLSHLESHPAWTATVLYLDDMAYSGSQMADFRGKQADADIEFYPIVAYQGESVDTNFYNFTNAQHYRQTMSTPVFTMGHWVKALRTEQGPLMVPGPLPTEDEVTMAMMAKLAGDAQTRPTFQYALRLYELFISACEFPAVVFEHKLADYASIKVHLFMQTEREPKEGMTESHERQLVQIGAGDLPVLETGSVAFYKTLIWRYKQAQLPDTTLLKGVYEVHHGML